jgi:hypothetical protein
MTRSRSWSRDIAFAMLAAAPSLACADGTLLFVSEPGDYIGGGTTYSLTFDDADVDVSGDASSLRVYYVSLPEFWSLALSAPRTRALTPACYERAQREPFAEAARPGVDFDFDGAGCNEVVGRYKLIELETDAVSGGISKLAVDFVQHCEGGGPALFGKLRYNSAVGLDTPALAPVFDVRGKLAFVSDPGDYIGGGQDRAFDLDRSNFSVGLNFDAGVSGFFMTDTDFWGVDFAAPDGTPLAVGSYDDAVRFPFQGPGQPGLDFIYDGAGCNVLSGSFDVTAIESDPIDGNPTLFKTHFVQHCENVAPALTADVYVKQVYTNGPLVDDMIFIDGVDGETAWPLVWNCD